MSPRLKIAVWAGIWIATRALMAAQVGFWDNVSGVELQDVNSYEHWAAVLWDEGRMPTEESWQYPPASAFLLLIPRIGGDYGVAFVVLMLLFELAGLACLYLLAKRERRDAGVWVWLLAMPVLSVLPILRIDLVPTVIAIAALVVIHRRPGWFGALAGVGAMVKVWPAFLLFAEWDRRRLLRSCLAALAAGVAILAIAWVVFGDQTGFLTNQGDRGLQVESVAATPWQLRQVITGTPPPIALRFGTIEIESGLGNALGKLLDLAAVAVLLLGAWWWWRRSAAIRGGREDLKDVVVSRDFAFTLILLFLVVSRVLSPQFMVWMVGLSAVVLSSGRTRLARPAWIVIAAVVITSAPTAVNLVIRNLALVVAVIDASVTMALALRERPTESPPEPARLEPLPTADVS
ncbi:MAG TPA: glycosyltransferase family 87 protein [Solirubrobacterales bacterium]|nr:glycosyltransferase family 87 protein [Solirubrobacterales bacterium]